MGIDRFTVIAARVIRIVAAIIAAILALGIAFKVFGGNPDNSIVSAITDAADAFAGPFDKMFTPHSKKLGYAVNWGIALVVYLIVAQLLAGAVVALGERVGRPARPREEE